MKIQSESSVQVQQNIEVLLETLPGFYRDDVENDESGLIQNLLSLLAGGLTQFDNAVSSRNKPVMRAVENGSSGFENYFPDILPSEVSNKCKNILSDQALSKIQYLLQYQSPAWPGALQLVQYFFPDKVITLEESVFTQRVLPAARMSQLKGNTELGETSVLGFRLDDYMNRCRFNIKTLSSIEAKSYLADSRMDLLRSILRIYLKQNLDVELQVSLGVDVEQKTALGEPGQALLGKKTWLSVTTGMAKEITIRL